MRKSKNQHKDTSPSTIPTRQNLDQDHEAWIQRKPARKQSEIPTPVRALLNQGRLESKNLVEWLSVDRSQLLDSIVEELEWPHEIKICSAELTGLSALQQSKKIGTHLSQQFELTDSRFQQIYTHRSDIVREWAAILIGQSQLTFRKKLPWIKPLADDSNSGVREIAWIALRNDVCRDPIQAIQELIPWTGSRRENLRRFASEITRPRGVWAPQIPELKNSPELGLPLLEPLRDDVARYVQNSIANWINDASKTCPDWVDQLTQRWLIESPISETQYIVRRARRSMA